jgi:hypothetical protein
MVGGAGINRDRRARCRADGLRSQHGESLTQQASLVKYFVL